MLAGRSVSLALCTLERSLLLFEGVKPHVWILYVLHLLLLDPLVNACIHTVLHELLQGRGGRRLELVFLRLTVAAWLEVPNLLGEGVLRIGEPVELLLGLLDRLDGLRLLKVDRVYVRELLVARVAAQVSGRQ